MKGCGGAVQDDEPPDYPAVNSMLDRLNHEGKAIKGNVKQVTIHSKTTRSKAQSGRRWRQVVSRWVRLTTETVQSTTLALQSVYDVKGGDSLPLAVLCVGYSITDNMFEECL